MADALMLLRQQRKAAVEKAEAVVEKAEKENRALTNSEQAELDGFMATSKSLAPKIEALESQSTLRTSFAKGPQPHNNNNGTVADPRYRFPGVADFLRTGDGGIKASLTEGGDLQYVLPAREVLPFITAYPSVDPFRQAGGNITDLEGGWVDANQPILTSGTDPSSFAESAGPSSDEQAGVYVAQLKDPTKFAFLCKPTEEALADIDNLVPTLTQEGIRRVINRGTKAATAALLTALASASATVAHTGDNLEDLLNLMAAIPSFFSSPSNAFMGSRRTLALIRNTRVGADNLPAFDPVTRQILGQNFIQNDYIPTGKLIFGDWRNGFYQRRSAVIFQLLNEVYREAGKVGLRFYQRSDSAFFAEAATASQSEQPLYLLTSDFGS